VTQGDWPPPHPSPPLPPPREYGSPGTPPDRRPLVAGVVAAVVLVALVVVLAVVLLGGDDEGDPTPAPARTSSAAAPATADASPAAAYSCWNGDPADDLAACPPPDGEAGLRWLFPAMEQARCGKAGTAGGEGVALRVLCVYKGSGTKVQLGYFQWTSVEAADAFYAGQGLTATDSADGTTRTYAGTEGQSTKSATLYLGAPFSVTTTYPSGAALSPEDQAALAPRPADQLAGAPAQ
jgi:hypothetical protein